MMKKKTTCKCVENLTWTLCTNEWLFKSQSGIKYLKNCFEEGGWYVSEGEFVEFRLLEKEWFIT